jgi:MYXO-CTERM domain-containing protein
VRNAQVAAAFAAGLVGLFAPAAADAHFVLHAPESWAAQDSQGQPQKTAPCGQADSQVAAVPSNAVTAFQAGQTITVTIDEVTYHPGHYRVVLSATGQGGLPADPVASPPGTCESLAIQDPPVFPVLADGMLRHTDPLDGPQSFEVTLPADVTCTRCTLQVLEFMSAEVGGNGFCFYHHCADISIAAATAGAGGGDGCACTAGGGGRASLAAMIAALAVAGGRSLRRRRGD